MARVNSEKKYFPGSIRSRDVIRDVFRANHPGSINKN